MYLDLYEKILPLSKSKTPDEIVYEWDFMQSYKSSEIDNCICGHEIKEVCLIKNKHSKTIIKVGNCCVRYFIDKTTESKYKEFTQIGVLRNKNTRKTYKDLIDHLTTMAKKELILFNKIKSNRNPDTNIAVMTMFEEYPKSKMGTTYRRLAKLREINLVKKVVPIELPQDQLSGFKANPIIPEKYSYMINPYQLKPWKYELAKEIWERIN